MADTAASAAEMHSLEAQAGEAARMLRLLANEHRLLVLCQLVAHRELSVGELTRAVDLSPSALSQHLARLRADGLVTTRREAQAIHYRVADPRVVQLLKTLKKIYCP